MSWKWAGYAKWALRLLLTELFLPGGTLVVLGLLLAGRFSPVLVQKVRGIVPFQRKDPRATRGGNLMAPFAMRRLE